MVYKILVVKIQYCPYKGEIKDNSETGMYLSTIWK